MSMNTTLIYNNDIEVEYSGFTIDIEAYKTPSLTFKTQSLLELNNNISLVWINEETGEPEPLFNGILTTVTYDDGHLHHIHSYTAYGLEWLFRSEIDGTYDKNVTSNIRKIIENIKIKQERTIKISESYPEDEYQSVQVTSFKYINTPAYNAIQGMLLSCKTLKYMFFNEYGGIEILDINPLREVKNIDHAHIISLNSTLDITNYYTNLRLYSQNQIDELTKVKKATTDDSLNRKKAVGKDNWDSILNKALIGDLEIPFDRTNVNYGYVLKILVGKWWNLDQANRDINLNDYMPKNTYTLTLPFNNDIKVLDHVSCEDNGKEIFNEYYVVKKSINENNQMTLQLDKNPPTIPTEWYYRSADPRDNLRCEGIAGGTTIGNASANGDTITVTGYPSSSCTYEKYEYKPYTRTWLNFCPDCKNSGGLVENPKGTPENELTCSFCDNDYDVVSGVAKQSNLCDLKLTQVGDDDDNAGTITCISSKDGVVTDPDLNALFTRLSGLIHPENGGSCDCWCASAELQSGICALGYPARTIQYATSEASNHRSVQYINNKNQNNVNDNSNWVNVPYREYHFDNLFFDTDNIVNGFVFDQCNGS